MKKKDFWRVLLFILVFKSFLMLFIIIENKNKEQLKAIEDKNEEQLEEIKNLKADSKSLKAISFLVN